MKMRGHPARQVHVTDSILNYNFLKLFVTLYAENAKVLMRTNFLCQYQCVSIVQSH